MKKIVILISAMLVALSCGNHQVKTSQVRTMEDIFNEVVDATTEDVQDQLSVRRTTALFKELADTLSSVMVRLEELHAMMG